LPKSKVKDGLKTANRTSKEYLDGEIQRGIATGIMAHLGTGSRSFNNGTYHDTTVQDQQLSLIFESLGQGIATLSNKEIGFETVGGKRRQTFARSRSQIRTNRTTGTAIAMAQLHQDEIEEAIFTPDGNVRADACTRLCFLMGVELTFVAGASLFANNVGKDEDIAECEKLSKMTSGGRLNERFALESRAMKIFSKHQPSGREMGQDANQPIDLHKDFKLKIDRVSKTLFNPSVFTTRRVEEINNDPTPKVKMIRLGSPRNIVDPDGVCYWVTAPEDQTKTSHSLGHLIRIPVFNKDGSQQVTKTGKPVTKTITLTEDQYKLHKEAKTAPKTNRNGTVSNPDSMS
jgi:hypothetical protein